LERDPWGNRSPVARVPVLEMTPVKLPGTSDFFARTVADPTSLDPINETNRDS
jgi:hypothetical protein